MVPISLRQARERRKLTQQQLEALSGVPQSAISALELGKRHDVYLSTAKQLSTALRMNILRIAFTPAADVVTE